MRRKLTPERQEAVDHWMKRMNLAIELAKAAVALVEKTINDQGHPPDIIDFRDEFLLHI